MCHKTGPESLPLMKMHRNQTPSGKHQQTKVLSSTTELEDFAQIDLFALIDPFSLMYSAPKVIE